MKSLAFSTAVFFLLIPLFCFLPSAVGEQTKVVRLLLVTALAGSSLYPETGGSMNGTLMALDRANRSNNGKGMLVGKDIYLKFFVDIYDDGGNATLNQILVKQKLSTGGYDFFLGSHTSRAGVEAPLGDLYKNITILCCVGPNVIYEPDRPYVFGIHGDSAKYTENFVKGAQLRGAKRIGIVNLVGSAFTETLAAATVNYASESRYEIFTFSYNSSADTTKYYPIFNQIADQLIDKKIDIFIGSTVVGDANVWYDVWLSKRYPLKGYFLAVAPSNNGWLSARGKDAQYLITGTQWDPGVRSSDTFFGNSKTFSTDYQDFSGQIAWYLPASGAAAAYTILLALNQTFYNKTGLDADSLFNSTNYENLRFTMSRIQQTTFFGDIEFDRLRRNRKDTITIQNINWPVATIVFPVEQSSADLVYPIPGTLYVSWSDGSAIFLGIITSICIFSCLLIGCVLLFFRSVSKASSPLFNILSVFGATMAASTLYFLPGIPTDGTCNAIPWFWVLGMTILFAPVLSKTVRIRRIIDSSMKMQVVVISDIEVLAWTGSLLLINILILSIWMGVSKFSQKNAECASDHTQAFIITFIVIFCIYIVVLCVLAFQVRNFRSYFNDASILMFCGAFLCILAVLFIPLIFYVNLDNQPDVRLLLVVAGILFSSVGVVYILYIPVIYKAFFLESSSTKAPGATSVGGNSMKSDA